MINRILMELYDDYEKGNINELVEFANKTFPNDGTSNLFIGCVLIMFSRCVCFKPRYDSTRENLYSIVMSAKEKIDDKNILAIYVDRINTTKGISKYLKDVLTDENLVEYANTILEYLDDFKPDFVRDMKYVISCK